MLRPEKTKFIFENILPTSGLPTAIAALCFLSILLTFYVVMVTLFSCPVSF
jgi:hypothetical protein